MGFPSDVYLVVPSDSPRMATATFKSGKALKRLHRLPNERKTLNSRVLDLNDDFIGFTVLHENNLIFE